MECRWKNPIDKVKKETWCRCIKKCSKSPVKESCQTPLALLESWYFQRTFFSISVSMPPPKSTTCCYPPQNTHLSNCDATFRILFSDCFVLKGCPHLLWRGPLPTHGETPSSPSENTCSWSGLSWCNWLLALWRCFSLVSKKMGVETMWVFPKIGVPQNGWFIMENPIKMDFSETPMWITSNVNPWLPCFDMATETLQIRKRSQKKYFEKKEKST